MVKNNGGNKSKRGARKHSFIPQNKKTRLPEEEGEVFAVVVKILGGPNCQVKCSDGKERLCVIRNKFRGRGKRDNIISPGIWVLVGVRDWEVRCGVESRCDLLVVYSSDDKEEIKKKTDKKILIALQSVQEPGDSLSPEDDVVDFVDNSKEEQYMEAIEAMDANENKEKKLDTFEDDNEIDWDDI